MSAHAFKRLRKMTACLVFVSSCTLSDTTKGISGTCSTACPLLSTKAGTPLAATAEAKAYLKIIDKA